MTADVAAPMLYLCAGMRRGGSTLQSQLVGALLGVDRVRPSNAGDVARRRLEDTNDGSALVIKCHEFVPEAPQWLASGEAKVTYVYRDIRDVVASICRKYSRPAFGFIRGGAAAILLEHAQWSGSPGVHVARYEDMVQDLPGEVERLAAYLGVAVDRDRVEALAAEFSPDRQRARIREAFESGASIAGHGADAHAASSLLHRNHIQSGEHGAYRQVLRTHEIAALEWVCRDWLRAHGYRFDSWRVTALLAYGWFALRSRLHSVRLRLFARDSGKSA